MRSNLPAVAVLVVGAISCSKADSGSASAPGSAAPAAIAGSAAAPAAAVQKFASGSEFLAAMKLPASSSTQKAPGLGRELFGFSGPKGTRWHLPTGGDPYKTQWASLSLGGDTMAILLASPEQDQGDQCPKLTDIKARVGDAKILKQATYEVPSLEKGDKTTTWGETIELLVFERDGRQGFYAHKIFDHGDDSTHVCCTAGAPSGAKDLKNVVEPSKVDGMIGVCMSVTFTF